MSSHVVVVESPAKAKTINKYLGTDYSVLASYGHVRDLPSKDGSVDPAQDFKMLWSVDSKGKKRLQDIAKELKALGGSGTLILATDPDREGEAISWHVLEELNRTKALKGLNVQRVVFNEVTKKAIQTAFSKPRDLDQNLIDAYLTRRALDYLVGFTLSPILWRKLPGSRSAGRVQSVALRLICEREAEIEIFKSQEYWSIHADLSKEKSPFEARLTHIDGKKLEKHTIKTETQAKDCAQRLEKAQNYSIQSVERKEVKRHPAAPFTTSTLQQEASRKLYFSASQTMQTAQKLYEGIDIKGETQGLITYMRTDGVTLSQEAVASAREQIEKLWGSPYVPESPRYYKTKAKNSQEAHEAIRPTDLSRTPDSLAASLTKDQLALYELIWKRTLASQMASARLNQVSVDIKADDFAVLRATGSTVVFAGFYTLYQESLDDQTEEKKQKLVPLEVGDKPQLEKIRPEQHFTQPPPRYTEASLVKKMEELGIGRPSTYASILQVLQDRSYVTLDKRRFIPEDLGRIVTTFLAHFFSRYVEYDFTATLEEQLDKVSDGQANWKSILETFWKDFSAAIEEAKGLSLTEVIDQLDQDLDSHFFPVSEENKTPRACPSCKEGRLGIKLGRTGAFIGCSNYPECKHTQSLEIIDGTPKDESALGRGSVQELGQDSEGTAITLRVGPYGPYVQLGEATDKGSKPKRVSLPKGMSPTSIDLDQALSLLSLPRELGLHEGESIEAGIGRYGPYVRKGRVYQSLGAEDDVLTIGLNKAVSLLAEKTAKTPAGRELGEHPDGGIITAQSGRYGPYVKWNKINATLPKTLTLEDVDLEQALELIAKKSTAKPKKKR